MEPALDPQTGERGDLFADVVVLAPLFLDKIVLLMAVARARYL